VLLDVQEGLYFAADSVTLAVLDACEGRRLVDVVQDLRARHPEKDIVSAARELLDYGVISDRPVQRESFTPPGRLEIICIGLDITRDRVGQADCHACPGGVPYMSEDVACRAVDLLIAESGRLNRCQVGFQGGDPLLYPQLVDRVMEYATLAARRAAKRVSFHVATHPGLLNEQTLALLGKRQTDITTTIPGHADTGLVTFAGSGPYSLGAVDILDLGASTGCRIHLVADLDWRAPDVRDRIRALVDRSRGARSLQVRVGTTACGARGVSECDLPGVTAALEQLSACVVEHVSAGQQVWMAGFEDHVAGAYNQRVWHYHCGGGTRYVSVAPSGELYVCPELAGVEGFGLGDVHAGLDRVAQRSWTKSTYTGASPSCASCWARNQCGGGCRAATRAATGRTGDPDPVGCAITRRTCELAMGASLEIAAVDASLLERRYGEVS